MASTKSLLPLILSRRAASSRYYGSVGSFGFTSGSNPASDTYCSRPITTASPRTFTQHYPSSICRTQSFLRTSNGFQRSSISTSAPKSNILGWMQGKLAERAQTKKAAKLVDQVSLMANSPTWTIKMFADEIDETLSSWTTKIPGAGKTAELQAAKESQKVVKAIMEQLGDNITAGDLSRLDRKQKLKLAIACQKPMGDLDNVLNSFTQMDIMHRILRYRKENGMNMPTDESGLKLAMQQDGMKVMTKDEKKEMREAYAKYFESHMS